MKQKTVLVIGLGNFGRSLVTTLWDHGAQIIAVDDNSEAVDAVKGRTSTAFVGDGVDPGVIEGIGAADSDTAVVTFGENFEASVLCVATLKRLGVKEIIARASNERQAEVLRTVGATRVLQLEKDMGRRVGMDILTPMASDWMDYASGFRVVPWSARGSLVGKDLVQAKIRQRYQISVIGVHKAQSRDSGHPKLEAVTPEYVISENDTLLLVGDEKSVSRFLQHVGSD